MTVLRKISDALNALIVVGMAGGFLWSLLTMLPEVDMHMPMPVVVMAAVVTLAVVAWLLELFMPLQAVSESAWVYILRPQAKIRTMDVVSVASLLSFALLGGLIGVALGNPALWMSVAALLRLLPLLRWKCRLPRLLSAGRRRTVGTAGLYIYDSELVSQGLAASAGRFWPVAPTANLWVLFFRRLHRRYYLWLIAAGLMSATVVLTCLQPQLAVGFFLIGWAVLTAAVIRCASFLPLVDAHHVSLTVVVVCALLGAMFVALVWGKPLLIPVVALGIGTSGWRRSKPREISSFTVVDTGYGITVPTGQLQYFSAGLVPVSIVAGVVIALL